MYWALPFGHSARMCIPNRGEGVGIIQSCQGEIKIPVDPAYLTEKNEEVDDAQALFGIP